MTHEYRELLKKTFGDSWEDAHAMVKKWAEQIQVAA